MNYMDKYRPMFQNRYGKGNYQLRWNHGGYSLFVKKSYTITGRNYFSMEAYDAETFCKDLQAQYGGHDGPLF